MAGDYSATDYSGADYLTGTTPITGTGGGTVGGVTGSGTGTVAIAGTGGGTLAALTGSGSGTVTIAGTGSGTLAPVTGGGSGSVAIAGTGSGTLGAATGSGSGALAIVGTGGGALAPATGSGFGVVTTGGPAGTPGGTFRRWAPTWRRTMTRPAARFGRVLTRNPATLCRVWRYLPVPTALLSNQNVVTAAADDDRDYGFDFSRCPELAGGATIAAAQVVGGAGLTLGVPAITADTFDGIPPGECVTVRISGGVVGTTYGLACKATLSTGRTVVIPAQLMVVSDY